MSVHKILQNLGVILLSALLFGCSLQNTPSSNGGFQAVDAGGHYDPYSRHHHRYHSKNSLSPDNPASEDYFRNQPVSTASDNNLWSAMKDNFQLNHDTNTPQVRAQINWFMNNQGYLDRTARRAAPFMYYIYQETKARHLPAELVLLPIIESAYNPFVSSGAGAAGLWQIEPATGRSFGLRQDWWYDGRKDIATSTQAALNYLSYLQNFFGGNWLLAIAAYDTGQGNVASAIRRNARSGMPTDFWSLHLAAETKAYVPRLLALAAIVSNPRAYGITLPMISNAPYLGEVEVGSQMTLEKAANLAGVSLEELKTLNAGYRHTTLDPHQPYKLLLPLDRISTFKLNLLNSTQDNTAGLWNRYKVQPGDSWRMIARRFNTSVLLLQSINRLHYSTPPEGRILLIPETSSNQASFATALRQQAQDTPFEKQTAPVPQVVQAPAYNLPEMPDVKQKTTHTVKHGETLFSIARMYHLSEENLARWNHISVHQSLRSGEVLHLFQPAGHVFKHQKHEKNERQKINHKTQPHHSALHANAHSKKINAKHHAHNYSHQKK